MNPPKGLGTRGRRLWKQSLDQFEFRPDELIVLEDACRHVDVVDALAAKLEGADLVTAGSKGQMTAHPLLQELRASKDLVAKLLRQLGLPDEVGGDRSTERSSAGRRLARQRWRMGA